MNKSVKRGRNRSGRELGGKRAVSGCVKVVVGWILVTHDGNGGLRSCDHRHGVSVKNGVKRGSEAECYLNQSFLVSAIAYWVERLSTLSPSNKSCLRVALHGG